MAGSASATVPLHVTGRTRGGACRVVTVTSGPRGADLTCQQVIRLMADYLESALTPEVIAELKRIWKDVSRASPI